MKHDGARFTEEADDLDRALGELMEPIRRDASLWRTGPPGKWEAGQHVEHVTRALELPLDAFDEATLRLRDGTLSRVPGRGPLQSLWVAIVVGKGSMPRGGKALPAAAPGEAPERESVERRFREASARYRALGAALDPGARDRLWIRNPFMTKLKWHYTLPEMVRVHAVHARHHAAQVRELAPSATS